MSLNRAMLIGYLGRDPEIRFLPSEQTVVNCSIATDESFTDKEGQKKEWTEWHTIVAFARLGEICAEHLKKGRQVFVEGRLRTREYDATGGSPRKHTEIVAFRVQFLGAPPAERNDAVSFEELSAPSGEDVRF